MTDLPKPLPSRGELEVLANAALDAARLAGASGAEVQVGASRALTTTVRMGEVESVEFQRDRDIGITVWFGQRSGSASTSDVSPDRVRQTVEAACAIARVSGEDPASGLPEAELLAREFPDLDLHHPWPIGADEAVELARACEAAGLALDRRLRQSEGASVDTRDGVGLLANSLGFAGWSAATEHSLSCALIAGEGDGMQVDHWYSAARAADDLEAVASVGREAGRRALARLGARRPPTGRFPVVYAADVARGLFGHLIAAASGGSLYRRASFLLDRLGEPVCEARVNIRQRPHLPRALGSANFDQEGVATREMALVENGVLQSYLLGSYAARKLGMRSTGNAGGTFNLEVESTAGDLAELLREMGRGVLVTDLMGQGVNLVTGDYSRGASGFWVENGQIQYPVQELTVAGNLGDMLRSIRAIGSDIDLRGRVRCGSVLIDGVMVAAGAEAEAED